MTITYQNYILEQEYHIFNLYKMVKRESIDTITKAKTGEIKDVKEVVGYGYSIESAINAIILDITENKTETVTLKEFLNECRKLKNEIAEIVKF